MLKYSFSLMALILGISSQVLGMDPDGDDAFHMRSTYAYSPTEIDRLYQQEQDQREAQERMMREQMERENTERMMREQMDRENMERMMQEQMLQQQMWQQ